MHSSNPKHLTVRLVDRREQSTLARCVLPVGGALPCPPLQLGDHVLVRVRMRGGEGGEGGGLHPDEQTGLCDCYIPGVVRRLPRDARKGHTAYKVMAFDGTLVTSCRQGMVKLAPSRYRKAVDYVMKMRNLKHSLEEEPVLASGQVLSELESNSKAESTVPESHSEVEPESEVSEPELQALVDNSSTDEDSSAHDSHVLQMENDNTHHAGSSLEPAGAKPPPTSGSTSSTIVATSNKGSNGHLSSTPRHRDKSETSTSGSMLARATPSGHNREEEGETGGGGGGATTESELSRLMHEQSRRLSQQGKDIHVLLQQQAKFQQLWEEKQLHRSPSHATSSPPIEQQPLTTDSLDGQHTTHTSSPTPLPPTSPTLPSPHEHPPPTSPPLPSSSSNRGQLPPTTPVAAVEGTAPSFDTRHSTTQRATVSTESKCVATDVWMEDKSVETDPIMNSIAVETEWSSISSELEDEEDDKSEKGRERETGGETQKGREEETNQETHTPSRTTCETPTRPRREMVDASMDTSLDTPAHYPPPPSSQHPPLFPPSTPLPPPPPSTPFIPVQSPPYYILSPPPQIYPPSAPPNFPPYPAYFTFPTSMSREMEEEGEEGEGKEEEEEGGKVVGSVVLMKWEADGWFYEGKVFVDLHTYTRKGVCI